MITKPKFWDNKIGFFSVILIPVTIIVSLYIFFKKKLSRPIKFNIPIICVGNIYIGGTGKTPTSILLAKELFLAGKNPVIVRKFYENHLDEHNLILSYFDNLILDNNRVKGIEEAISRNYDTVILDDGFQEYKIKKKLNIICFNANQLIGNGLIIPSGPLRESLKSLKNVDIALINGERDIGFEKKILKINEKLKIFYSFYEPLNINEFKGKDLIALASIGNPDNFFKLLEKHKLKINKKLTFPDHYKFTEKQINDIIFDAEKNDFHVVMTEKDFTKFKIYKTNRINCLKVSLKIKEKEKFIQNIKAVYA